jgi:threonine 3-dehydrogenase
MSILITGGAGFIGMALAKALVQRGETVVIFDKVIDRSVEGENARIVSIQGDISNWPEVLQVVQERQVETIFHLAAMLSAPSDANPWAAVNVNAFGTFYVLEAARLFRVKKMIFTSSLGVYSVTQDTVVTEETPQRPHQIYGVTKLFAELLGLYYQRKFGLDFRGVRFPQLIGPGVRSFGFGQYNPRLIEAAITGDPFDVWVPEETVIPLMYIKDAVRSLIMIYEAPEEKLETRVYNLGQIVPPPTARDVVEAVKEHYPDARITFKPDPNIVRALSRIPRVMKGELAEREWGWKVEYSLRDTVRDFIDEFKKMRTEEGSQQKK